MIAGANRVIETRLMEGFFRRQSQILRVGKFDQARSAETRAKNFATLTPPSFGDGSWKELLGTVRLRKWRRRPGGAAVDVARDCRRPLAGGRTHDESASSKALASFRSSASKPSVNQP